MSLDYQPLDKPLTDAVLGALPTTITGGSVSFFASITFLFIASYVIITVVTGGKLVQEGARRMTGNPYDIKESTEGIKRISFTYLILLSLVLIFMTINPDIISGNIGLEKLEIDGKTVLGTRLPVREGVNTSTSSPTTPITSSKSCDGVENVKQSVASGNVCASTACSALSGCNYSKYLPIIKQEASKQGVDPRVVVAIMCRESKGNPNAQGKNTSDGTYDCGLMQINQKGPCDASSLAIEDNITRGVSLLKQKLSVSSRVYPGVPALANTFASYNCCANGTRPSDQSVDCNTGSGWPTAVPKWVCPINPGSGDFNMCAVKNYACDVVSCVEGGALNGL